MLVVVIIILLSAFFPLDVNNTHPCVSFIKDADSQLLRKSFIKRELSMYRKYIIGHSPVEIANKRRGKG